MITALVSVGVGTLLFLCLYAGFRTGLRLGMQTARGQIPPKFRNPVEVVKDAITPPKTDPVTTELIKGYANMMAFTGEIPEKR